MTLTGDKKNRNAKGTNQPINAGFKRWMDTLPKHNLMLMCRTQSRGVDSAGIVWVFPLACFCVTVP